MGVVRKRGDKWYIDYYNSDGKRIVRVAGNTKKQAEKILAQLEANKYDKKFGIKSLERYPTDKLFNLFMDQKKKRVRQRTQELYETRLKFWENKHTKQYFSPLSMLETEEALNELSRKGFSAKTINNYLNLLKQLYKYAIDLNIINESPIEKIKRLKIESRKTPRFFTYEEAEKILEASEKYKDIFTILLYTGMRRNELRFLEWEDIDFKSNNIKIRNKDIFTTKSGKGRNIPIHPKVYEVLNRLKKSSGLIFPDLDGKPYRRNEWYYALKKVLNKLEIKNAALHTFRHTFASWLVMEGVDLSTVAELLGHSDIKTTQIYSHLAPEHLQKSIEKLK